MAGRGAHKFKAFVLSNFKAQVAQIELEKAALGPTKWLAGLIVSDDDGGVVGCIFRLVEGGSCRDLCRV